MSNNKNNTNNNPMFYSKSSHQDSYRLLCGEQWLIKSTPTNPLAIHNNQQSTEQTTIVATNTQQLKSAETTTITQPDAQSCYTPIPDNNLNLNQVIGGDNNANWQQLITKINNCTKCTLHTCRTNAVIERGNRQANWMFIGEGPGEQEDIQSSPFVGLSGQLLNKMINAIGLNIHQDVYICNAIKCRPPKNRNPLPEELSSCRDYLLQQIRLVRPQIIVLLGRFASQTTLNSHLSITELRGKGHYVNNLTSKNNNKIIAVVTYHPAYLLRNPAAKKDAWLDLQLAKQYADALLQSH